MFEFTQESVAVVETDDKYVHKTDESKEEAGGYWLSTSRLKSRMCFSARHEHGYRDDDQERWKTNEWLLRHMAHTRAVDHVVDPAS